MANDTLEELQKAAQELRNGLKNVDEDIKKLTGRDPSETPRPGGYRRVQLKRNSFQRGNRQDEPLIKQRRETDGAATRRWGRTMQIGSRVSIDDEIGLGSSGEEDESSKPAIQSVVATDTKPVRLQTKPVGDDKETKSRNRRMFGLLIGTLQRFKEDTKEKTAGEKKRQEIEQKLEQKAEQEKLEVTNQRKELFQTRKQRQQELKILERKMENVLLKEEIAAHNKELENFIMLKSNPKIFYIPAKHNNATKQLLEESKALIKELQDKRFKDMDLDADDVGVNSWSNRQASNGKKLMGRVIQEKDVSHKDLFEEEKRQEEPEREDEEGKDVLEERIEENPSFMEADGRNEGLSQVNEERRSLIEREQLMHDRPDSVGVEMKETDEKHVEQREESLIEAGIIRQEKNEERNAGGVLMGVSKDVQEFVSNNLNSTEVGYSNMPGSNDVQMHQEQESNWQEFDHQRKQIEGGDRDFLQEGKNVTHHNVEYKVDMEDEATKGTVESHVNAFPEYHGQIE